MSTVFEPVIGIEVHAQLKTKSKLFCACSTQFGNATNGNVCPVCLGLPGALPVLNKAAVEMAIKAGLALNCTVKHNSVFSRKNYFYPDLPKGYQISQFDLPICENGHLDIVVDGQPKRIGITRIHMEEDAGKLLHQGSDSIAGADYSLVDLNRASVPLIEIVSEPDIRSAKEARAYMESLKLIVQHLEICDGNLEEGSLRADANISIRPQGQEKFGTRTEIKNINSFRSLERAILGEIDRQTDIINGGGSITQQTRNYDDNTQTTTPLRDKEESHDYRYFPEPDLMPLVITDEKIKSIKETMDELPADKAQRYISELGLTEKEAKTIISDHIVTVYFDKCIALDGIPAKELSNWVLGDLLALSKENKQTLDQCKVTPEKLIELLQLKESGKISGKIAKDILQKVFNSGESPKTLVEKEGASQISDSGELQGVVDQILSENQDVVEKVKAGKTKSADFLMGQVMKATRGRAKPDLVKTMILDTISRL